MTKTLLAKFIYADIKPYELTDKLYIKILKLGYSDFTHFIDTLNLIIRITFCLQPFDSSFLSRESLIKVIAITHLIFHK